MSFRGRGRLRAGFLSEIEGLDTAEYPPVNVLSLEQQKQDIERYSDRQLQRKDVRRPLWQFIQLYTDHMPAELADEKKCVKKVKWTTGSDVTKFDYFEKLEQQCQGKEGTEKKENEEEEDEEVIEEDQGEYSDEGDYEQADNFDDDEDDFNMADDANEACY